MSTWNNRTLQWRHNGRDDVSNHQSHDCLLKRLFRHRSKKTPKLRVTCLCAVNSPVTGEFPAQMAIWWRHQDPLNKLTYNTFIHGCCYAWHICGGLFGYVSAAMHLSNWQICSMLGQNNMLISAMMGNGTFYICNYMLSSLFAQYTKIN